MIGTVASHRAERSRHRSRAWCRSRTMGRAIGRGRPRSLKRQKRISSNPRESIPNNQGGRIQGGCRSQLRVAVLQQLYHETAWPSQREWRRQSTAGFTVTARPGAKRHREGTSFPKSLCELYDEINAFAIRRAEAHCGGAGDSRLSGFLTGCCTHSKRA